MTTPKETRQRFSAAQIIGIAAVVIVALVVGGALAVDQLVDRGRIVRGVAIGGTDVGGLDANEAAAKLRGLSEATVTVTIDPATDPVPLFGSQLDLGTSQAIDDAMRVGRVGALPQRIAERANAWTSGADIALRASDTGAAAGVLEQAHKQLDRPATDAGFELRGDKLLVRAGTDGSKVDDASTLAAIGTAATSDAARTVQVSTTAVAPAVSTADAEKLLPEAEAWTARAVTGSAESSDVTISRQQLASLLEVREGRLTLSEERLSELLAGSGLDSTKPVDARFDVVGGQVRIIPGTNGSGPDVATTAASLEKALASGADTFEIAYAQRQPEVTTSDLEKLGIKNKLSSFTTEFRLDQDKRDVNIALAAGKVRGQVVGIGEVFSLNEATGPRDKSTGYKESLIFQNGKVVPGIGGGVCQVSSTLYQAVLYAGQEVVDRQNHSMAVSYLKPGLDATTYYPIVDLQFRNTSGGPILLWSEVKGNKLTMSVYGATQPKDIKITTKVKKTIAPRERVVYTPALPHNVRQVQSPGAPGYIVTSYRLTYRDGVLVKREVLSTDEYQPKDAVVEVGT